MVTDFPIQAILDRLVERIVEILPVSAAGVTVIEPPAAPRYVAASDESALRYEQLQTSVGDGPCLAAYRTGEAVSIEDVSAETRFASFLEPAAAAGLAAAFTFPLRHASRPLGALDLYRDAPGTLSEADMVTAQTLADVTSAYLANAQARADLEDASERSQERALHDGLTGLPNRALLLERLGQAARRTLRSHRVLALFFVDLDDFKAVNDRHGHQVGDELLIAVSRRVREALRPGDTLARLSGDEFVVLCEELDNEHQAAVVAERVLAVFEAPFDLAGIKLPVSASIGIAFAGHGDDVPDQLLHHADLAMYQAKRSGGAGLQVLDVRRQLAADHRTSLAHDLREASDHSRLRAEYQPIVRTHDGRIVGAEALLRWDHPAEGSIAPRTMIPLAEHEGLIVEIGRWMLHQACTDRHRWVRQSALDGCGVAINLSPDQLAAPGFARSVADVLADTNTSAQELTLELTESALVQDPDRALSVLDELKLLGVRLALDDFGTGYSSLNHLSRYPVDVVKIDRTLIGDMGRNSASHAIVSTVIQLSHLLGVAVIAEGVETAGQRDDVDRMGAELCQGHYFGHPMSSTRFAALTM
jgi:diguanylate cyclase (GGDEF)-like protein